jgi:hypothetical protein
MRANIEKLERQNRVSKLKDEANKLTKNAMHKLKDDLKTKKILDYINAHKEAVVIVIRFCR